MLADSATSGGLAMKVRFGVLVVALTAVMVVGLVAPAGAGSNGLLRIDAVVNGTPTSQLQIRYECVGSFPVGPTVVDVDATGTVVAPFNVHQDTCSVEIVQAGGLVTSFACVSAPAVTCNPGNASVTGNGLPQSDAAVITVTFDPAPPTPGADVAAALDASPSTVG